MLLAACSLPATDTGLSLTTGTSSTDAVHATTSRAQAPGAWHALSSDTPRSQIPGRASAPARVAHGGVAVGFRLAGARPVAAARVGNETRYEGALGAGTALRLRERANGAVEDLVDLETAPAGERLDYVLDVSEVAGLRQVEQVVEFLDAEGSPRLRMRAPTIEGADGRVAEARVDLGCAHDTSPAAPWGRAVVAPGGGECRMTLSWAGRGVRYPAVLDPVWETTGDMVKARVQPVQGLLANGLVLVAGGRTCGNSDCTGLSDAELYNPAKGTWALTGSTDQPRDRAAGVMVPKYGFVVISGNDPTPEQAVPERYSEATGTWSKLAAMPEIRTEPLAVLASDDRTIVVTGGLNQGGQGITTVALFSATTGQWSDGGSLPVSHYLASGTALPDGRVMISGGSHCYNCGPQVETEIYDPVTKTYESVPMSDERFNHLALLIKVGTKSKVLVAAGGNSKSELFDLETKKWSPVGDATAARVYAANHLLPDGTALMAGGGVVPTTDPVDTAERFDPDSLTWKPAGKMAHAHAGAASQMLPDGRVIVAGGANGKILSDANTITATDVFTLQPQGAACQGAGECATRFCADGVCCQTACDGECQACTAAKQGKGKDGTCGPIASDTDPDEECPIDSPTTCGRTGQCSGQGKCARYAVNTPCGAATCTNNVSSGALCNAAGACAPSTQPCAPYRCKDPTACGTKCDSDEQCVDSAHCDGSKECVGDLAVGAACDRSAMCASGFCVDGVCCQSACDGTCVACSAERKESGQDDGICDAARKATDPHSTCADTPVSGCDQDGSCDGQGKCSLYAKGTPCQGATCEGDTATGFSSRQGYVCDGQGTCASDEPSTPCGDLACRQGQCLSACQADADCLDAKYCVGGTCKPRNVAGTACSESRECADGFCVDGVCCQSPCQGPCEACAEQGFAGICKPVSGQPRGTQRKACDEAPAGRPCEARTCDGVVRTSCAGYVGEDVRCHDPSCTDGLARSAEFCDGKGACPDATEARCEPYVCDGDACRNAKGCASDTDCAPRFRCDLTATPADCVPRTVAACDGNHTLILPDGKPQDCGAYTCDGDHCRGSCDSVLECVLPNVCDASSHSCVPPRPNPDDGACQASAGAAPRPGLAALALAGALVALARRTRRRGVA